MAEINSAFDCAATDLLCNEETKALCLIDDADDFIFSDHSSRHHQINNGAVESQPWIDPLTEESIGWMVERERRHLPRQDYAVRLKNGDLDMSLRCEALDWIIKACSHHNFGELCLYSAMNFLDRFLSAHTLPGGRPWAIHLLAVSCLSLSAKINEVNVPCIVELQAGDPKFLFEGRTIQRMEILVLNCLNWNMSVYTPFSFIDYFLRRAADRSQVLEGMMIKRSIQIIMTTMEGIDFLEFRPSEIAAAVAWFVSDDIQEAMDIDKALFGCIGVEKGRVLKCLEMVRDLVSRTEAISASTITSTAAETIIADAIMTGSAGGGAITSSVPYRARDVITANAGAVILPMPLTLNGVLDTCTATLTAAGTTTATVRNSADTSLVPPGLDGAFDAASTGTSAATTITTGSVGNSIGTSPVPPSPNGVLDAAFMSYKSGERGVESCPSSSHTSPDTKRRKLDHVTSL